MNIMPYMIDTIGRVIIEDVNDTDEKFLVYDDCGNIIYETYLKNNFNAQTSYDFKWKHIIEYMIRLKTANKKVGISRSEHEKYLNMKQTIINERRELINYASKHNLKGPSEEIDKKCEELVNHKKGDVDITYIQLKNAVLSGNITESVDDYIIDNEIVQESIIISDKDLKYNLEEFKDKKIDKLFITGYSGSGKTSAAYKLAKEYDATVIELDDLLNPAGFSDDKLKEYDENIYKFFIDTKIGKDYRNSKDKAKNVTVLIPEFIKYIVTKSGRYIIEGIYLMFYIVDGDKFDPGFFNNYAFILKGTSAILSAVRQTSRDIKNDKDSGYDVSPKDALSFYIKMIKDRVKANADYKKTRRSILEMIKESTEDIVLEAVKPETKIMLGYVYPKVESVLCTQKGDRDFKNAVGRYLDRNHSKLHTVGPQYLIPFTDQVKQEFFDIFGINKKDLIIQIKTVTKSISNSSNFIYLNNNPIFFVFYCCIRYYQLNKDEKGLNTALVIYALSVYPSVFSNSFKYEPNPQVMQYTIDHLSEKFLIRKSGDLFGMLFTSIQHSYDFLKDSIKVATDGEMIRFIQRIRNDQKSLIKNICDEYMVNHRNGLRTSTTKDSNLMNNKDISNMDVEKDNDSSVVDAVTNKVIIPIISSGVNLQIVAQAKDIAGISLSDCKYYMSKILTDVYIDDIRHFIQAILFRYMYDEHKTAADINSKYFLVWSSKLFRQTNSKNENIKIIKDTLSKWADETGIYSKFKREASRVNYKKAIFFYFIIAIQYYNR